ncbi:two-component system, OmpR family, alkaline phosphatase synthesis response regulator PhoP [Alteribacillus persepolensis]|uniref:Two-component system, OmpR family, alkaline phosphatase synthesis response regulator PhoP n=1 Tax=Alteribacillus persepolensis TaxID=568899 RepID=A0A1G8BJ27_9BACI|nr:response regulator transcription factor [Alteribacillus persepolensis]SDH33237.1 two-component system, OmpR family, alkaline phosphatase synthesis response regulator PhoP [Alteribacillus persepolensis]
MPQKLLVVDDEESIITLLSYNLEQAGFQVDTAMDGKEAMEKVRNASYELVVLDLMLPEMDGLEVCRQMRQDKVSIPILMLTAKDDEFDKVLGLELGADDYMTKPFSPRELVARVKAILRRVDQAPVQKEENMTTDKKLLIGHLTIYPENYEVYVNDEQLELTPKEFELLLYLSHNKGRVMTRDQLLNAVWNYEFVGDTRIVDVHISHLREKIEPNTKKPVYIKTVRGLGYKFEEPPVT